MLTIRTEDLRGSAPDALAVHQQRLREAARAEQRRAETFMVWEMRRRLALAILAGWRPPTAAERWWTAHEADALAYADLFADDPGTASR